MAQGVGRTSAHGCALSVESTTSLPRRELLLGCEIGVSSATMLTQQRTSGIRKELHPEDEHHNHSCAGGKQLPKIQSPQLDPRRLDSLLVV